MCPDSDRNAQCNRIPFKSEDGCNRGSVDIHQFDDFPYCGEIVPTDPAVTPEVVDGPIPVPIPSFACTCFDITYGLNLGYNMINPLEFSTSESFYCKGDCCSGRYMSDLKLKIPCPVKNIQGRRLHVGIKYGDGPKSDSASVVRIESSACTIEPILSNIDLNLPCPATTSGNKSLKVAIGYGEGPQTDVADYITTDRLNCTINPLSPTLSLNLPCPIKGAGGRKKVKASIAYGEGRQSASADFISLDHEPCEVEAYNANLDLQIPCPLKGLDIQTTYRQATKGSLKVRSNYYPKSCSKTFTIDLVAPCPVIGAGTRTITASLHMGGETTTDQAVFMNLDQGGCTFSAADASLSLNVPCPISKGRLNIITQSETGGDVGQLYVANDTYDAISCNRNITLKAVFPKPSEGGGSGGGGGGGGGYVPDGFSGIFSLVTHVDYSTHYHTLTYTTRSFKFEKGLLKSVGGESTHTAFEAVGHTCHCS